MLLLLVTTAIAADLPDAPSSIARPAPPAFWTTRQKWSFGANIALRTVDAAYTCHLMSAYGGHEAGFPTQSCAGVAAWSAGMTGAEIGTAYFFHQTHHYQLERWTPIIYGAAAAAGILSTAHNWAGYPHHPCGPNWPCN